MTITTIDDKIDAPDRGQRSPIASTVINTRNVGSTALDQPRKHRAKVLMRLALHSLTPLLTTSTTPRSKQTHSNGPAVSSPGRYWTPASTRSQILAAVQLRASNNSNQLRNFGKREISHLTVRFPNILSTVPSQCYQPRHEIHRLEDHMRRAVTVGCFQPVSARCPAPSPARPDQAAEAATDLDDVHAFPHIELLAKERDGIGTAWA